MLAGGLVALLAVVSLAARSGDHGRAVPGGSIAGPAGHHALAWVLLVLGPIAAVLGLGIFLYAQIVRRRDPEIIAMRRRARRRMLVLAVIAAAFVIYTVRTGQNPLGFLHVHNPFASTNPPGSGKNHAPPPGHSDGFATIDWVVAGLTWLLIVAGIVMAVRRLRRAPEREAASLAEADDEPADTRLERLRAESDPRRAVIGAYALMDRVMADRELGRRKPEAPLEYLGRMTAAGYGRITALGRLTRLYARARFSAHPVDRDMQAEAVDAVAKIAGEDPG